MRTIGVVTVSRSDYGLYRPVLQRIQQDSELELHLMVSGPHLSPERGYTVRDIEEEGYAVAERIETVLSSDTSEGIAKSIGLGVIGFGQAFARSRPDILLILGDRSEMYAAAVAALPFTLPVAHMSGSEAASETPGGPLRHSITKLSHLHFVPTETVRARLVSMGEEPWRVTLVGAPSADEIIVERLKTVPLGASLVAKRFHDLAPLEPVEG